MASTLNRFGLALTAFFGLGGVVSLLGPSLGVSFGSGTSGVLWLGIACLILVRWRRGNIEAGRREQIVETGARGVATVVSASRRGADRDFPKLCLRLRLDVPGFDSREVDHEEEVARYAAYGIKPSLRLPVVVDPRDPGRIVLVW